MMHPPSLWQEARNPDGRVYYYNTQTKATQWTKPQELMSPAERALASSPWKEYTAAGGRKYWHNTETDATTWEMPDAFKQALAQPPMPKPAAPAFVPSGSSSYQEHARPRDDHYHVDRTPTDRQSGYGQMDGFRSSAMPPQAQNEPDYTSYQEAEAAFFKLLRRAGVQPDWTWEQMLKACVKDPQYRAIKDPKDRKAAFEKYVAEVRAQEKDREKERQEKLRADFTSMLRTHPEITYYTRWRTARPIIEGETIFRSARSEEERLSLFNEYRNELLKAHNESESKSRKDGMEHLANLLQSLDLEPYTRWAEVQEILKADERFQGDKSLKSLPKIDVLKTFENHIKSLERSFNDERQKQKLLKARTERQNRDNFIALLKDLKSAGKIKAGSKWSDIHDLIEDDPRYVAMLGQPGSTPLDLFWDVVEDEERVLRARRIDVLDVLEDKRYELTHKTTYEEFHSLIQTDRRTAHIPSDMLRLIFQRLREKIQRRNEEEKHTHERHQRRAIDALRSRLKHLDNPPVSVSDTWDSVRPRIEKSEEYRALENDDARKQAFDKFMRRLKDREEDEKHRQSKAERGREREHRRERDKDRERGVDSHRPSGNAASGRRHTRTPEVDAYEADRKKAQADRERQFRKAAGTMGLSPPPSAGSVPPLRRGDDRYEPPARDRGRERDHYDGRRDGRRLREERSRSRSDRGGHYERERRERDSERERSYLTRSDPRERPGEATLDYGESGASTGAGAKAGSGRRRRESEVPDVGRDVKRPRREPGSSREATFSPRIVRRSKTPPGKKGPPPVEHGYKSGSEEGEIEEE